MDRLHGLRYGLERLWKRTGGRMLRLFRVFRVKFWEAIFAGFVFVSDWRKRNGRRGTLALLLAGCVGVVALGSGTWYSYGMFRLGMAEWRGRQAIALLDQNQPNKALLKAQTAFLAYPEDITFLRILTKVSRQARVPSYRFRAEQLVERPEVTAEEILVFTDDLLDAGESLEARKWLQVARMKGLGDEAYAERALKLSLRAGRPGSLSALLTARHLVEEGSEKPDVVSAYASLCLMLGDEVLRKEACERLRKWRVRKDETGEVALLWLARFPELPDDERKELQAILAARLAERQEGGGGDPHRRLLREINLCLSKESPAWDDALERISLHKGILTGAEAKALQASIFWRKGSKKKARDMFRLAVGLARPEDLSRVGSEVWATGDPLIEVTLLEKYARRPEWKLLAEATLVPLYCRLGQYERARQLAKGVVLPRFRSLPEVLCEVGRWMVLLGEDEVLGGVVDEMERLVSRFPHDVKYRQVLALSYHCFGEHHMALELVPDPPDTFAVLPRARAKALRFACFHKLGAELGEADRPSNEERAILEPLEREFLGLLPW